MKRFQSTTILASSLLLFPSAIHAFVAPAITNINGNRQPQYSSRLHQQQPYYNEADGQYYYYNSSDGNYYSETGQMWVGEQQYDQQNYDQQAYEQQNYDQQVYDQQQNYNAEPSLILGNDIAQEMNEITAQAGMDYLALARQRAAEKRESVNISTDGDWLNLADEIKRKAEAGGEKGDGWDESLNEDSEGDAASLGLGGFVTEAGIVVEGDDGDEPTLLL